MNEMYRGSTPTITIRLPFGPDECDILSIAFGQYGQMLFNKRLPDCIVDGNSATVVLTEEETLMLDPKCDISVQCRAKIAGKNLVSRKRYISVGDIIEDGVLK